MAVTENQRAEIENARAVTQRTRRPTVEAMEEILYTPFTALDHGFVRVVDYMGDDDAIVQAARVSYGVGTRKVSTDAGLIRYLLRHRHTTPFEMCEIKFHVKMPIFVARQWIRHRTANVNEYSARYSILDKEFYIPMPEHLAAQSKTNRQGRGDTVTGREAERVFQILGEDSERAHTHYIEMLNEDAEGATLDESRLGLARELARMNLPLNTYTQWYWKIDLHNLFHFLGLRADSHAQYEIRVYAEVILHEIVKRWVPSAYQAFMDYQMHAAFFSAQELPVLGMMLEGKNFTQETSGLKKGEWAEFQEKIARVGKKI